MKIKFYCDSHANAFSCREEIIDIEDLGITAEEWEAMSDQRKHEEVIEWAWTSGLEVGWEPVEP